jgi:hypothetical protein
MFRDDFFSGLRGVAFRADQHGGGTGDAAPVIEDARDMADAVGGAALDNPHREIPILGPLIADAEAAHFADEQGAVDAEVADVVLDVEEIRVPVGLEIVVVAVAVLVDFIFVAVNQISKRVGIEFEGDAGERVGADFIVVVE